jgi:hypothetical protein
MDAMVGLAQALGDLGDYAAALALPTQNVLILCSSVNWRNLCCRQGWDRVLPGGRKLGNWMQFIALLSRIIKWRTTSWLCLSTKK